MAPAEIPKARKIIEQSSRIFTIGVAGDSGSGKTTFTRAIREIFGADIVSSITLDDYHILDREQRRARRVTPLAPESNDIARLERDFAELKAGHSIMKPVYNHVRGTIDPPVPFTPTKILILEGLHTFFTPKLRECLDIKIFVDPDWAVKRFWKIQRDMEVRGYRRQEIVDELEDRAQDYQRYVAPQMAYADATIHISFSKYGEELGPERNIYHVSLSQSRLPRMVSNVDLPIDLSDLLSLSERGFLLEFSAQEANGSECGVLTFDGEIRYDVFHRLEQLVEEQVEMHPISLFHEREFLTGTEITQLLLAWRIINKRIFMEPEPA